MVLLSTCTSGGEQDPPPRDTAAAETQAPSDAPTAEPETTEEAMDEDTVITDMAGREVTLPVKIETVFGVNNTASILIYTMVAG